MTEFTKMKISFAMALLGTLFALHPFLDHFTDRGFLYLGYDLKVLYPYSLTAGLLSLCVYLYAVTLLNDRPHSWFERTGNSVYALAILVLPVYAGLFVSARLADRVAVSHVAWAAPMVALGMGFGWVALSQVLAWRIRRRLSDQDRLSRIDHLRRLEHESLDRARKLFTSDHYDLTVVEACRALEARLRQALLVRGLDATLRTPQAVVQLATRKGILRGPVVQLVSELEHHRAVALSTEPLPKEAAAESLSAVRHILAVVPVQEHSQTAATRTERQREPRLVEV